MECVTCKELVKKSSEGEDLIGSKMECVTCKELVKKSSEGAILHQKGAKSINEASLQRGDDIKANVGESVHIKCRKNYVKQRNIEAAKMKQLQPGEKRVLQSEVIVQCDFRKHCLFCSQADIVVKRRILN